MEDRILAGSKRLETQDDEEQEQTKRPFVPRPGAQNVLQLRNMADRRLVDEWQSAGCPRGRSLLQNLFCYRACAGGGRLNSTSSNAKGPNNGPGPCVEACIHPEGTRRLCPELGGTRQRRWRRAPALAPKMLTAQLSFHVAPDVYPVTFRYRAREKRGVSASSRQGTLSSEQYSGDVLPESTSGISWMVVAS